MQLPNHNVSPMGWGLLVPHTIGGCYLEHSTPLRVVACLVCMYAYVCVRIYARIYIYILRYTRWETTVVTALPGHKFWYPIGLTIPSGGCTAQLHATDI